MSRERPGSNAAGRPATGGPPPAVSWPQPSGGFAWMQASWGPVLQCAPLGAHAVHVFTTATLRLVGDQAEWAAVAAWMGVTPGGVRLVRQVHGVAVTIVRAGGGTDSEHPEADIIVSDDPATAIGVRVADCAPVLLADTRRGVVAAVHAGWRGTVRRAAAAAVDALREAFGSDPRDQIAAIGPCLGASCGEMGPEVREMFRAAGHPPADLDRWFTAGGGDRSHLDLAGANRDQLVGAGLPPTQVFIAGLCTKSHSAVLHSYRAHGSGAGRMAAMIRAR